MHFEMAYCEELLGVSISITFRFASRFCGDNALRWTLNVVEIAE
jgi:hypothetical protein